jgi:HK97 family phage portal protein
MPSPWSGWPAEWSTPQFDFTSKLNRLIDIAWACLDLNTNVLSSMPVYQTRDGRIIEPMSWMTNPDPLIYSSWQEFAKQLFWDFQMGEAFVMPMSTAADGYPMRFRVVPPWLVNVELRNASRTYNIGSQDLTGEILHIRYWSTTDDARGHGPLEVAGARMTAVGLLQRYANSLAETGGKPLYWMELQRKINEGEGRDLLDRWIESRTKYAGHPALVAGGATLHESKSMSARDMALMELSQFNESRIAILLGVPPFLVGLAGASGSLTYSNIADLFDFHDRSSLRPKARMAMEALSGWALPHGRAVELNRDDYTRLPIDKRYAAYKTGIEAGFLTIEEVRAFERLHSEQSAQALTGGAE